MSYVKFIMLNNFNDKRKILEVKLLQVKNLYGSEMKEWIGVEFSIFYSLPLH